MPSRGCGSREEGGAYLTVGCSEFGKPLEDFIVDPPKPIPPEAYRGMGLSPIGVKLIQDPATGITHVFDHVGSEHYPTPADVIEEARWFLSEGLNPISRRINRMSDLGALSPESNLILLHSRAWIDQWAGWYEVMANEHRVMAELGEGNPYASLSACPKDLAGHNLHWGSHGAEIPTQHCAGLWWHDFDAGDLNGEFIMGGGPRVGVRSFVNAQYRAWTRPTARATYGVAIFASFPLKGIEVIRHGDEAVNKRNADLMAKAGIGWEMCEE